MLCKSFILHLHYIHIHRWEILLDYVDLYSFILSFSTNNLGQIDNLWHIVTLLQTFTSKLRSELKNPNMFKVCLLIENPQFLSILHDTSWKLLSHKLGKSFLQWRLPKVLSKEEKLGQILDFFWIDISLPNHSILGNFLIKLQKTSTRS